MDVPEKLDLFHDKYFPPVVERAEKTAMCVTLQQVHSNLYHPSIAQLPPQEPPHAPPDISPIFHLPHSPLAMVISPPLGYHMISRDRGEKKVCCSTTTVGLVSTIDGCSRSDVVQGTASSVCGARPTTNPGIPKFLLALAAHNLSQIISIKTTN